MRRLAENKTESEPGEQMIYHCWTGGLRKGNRQLGHLLSRLAMECFMLTGLVITSNNRVTQLAQESTETNQNDSE